MERVSVILPVYNERETIADTLREFKSKVIDRCEGSRLIVAEDGSRDGTKEVLRELQGELGFELVSGEERKGYTKAFKDALAIPDTPLIFFCDSDAQHDPADFFKLLPLAGDYDVVGGYKSPRRDPFLRLLMSRVYNTLIGLLFGTGFRDVNAGFKLMRREVVDQVLPLVRDLRHCVMSEFMVKAHLKGFRITEVPVVHKPREAGSSIFTARNIVPVVLNVAAGILKIRFRGP